jgi:hypothetical protein
MSDISDLSLSSSDEDEERIPRRRRALRNRINPFDLYDEQECGFVLKNKRFYGYVT